MRRALAVLLVASVVTWVSGVPTYDFATRVKNCHNPDDMFYLRERLVAGSAKFPTTITLEVLENNERKVTTSTKAEYSCGLGKDNRCRMSDGKVLYAVDGSESERIDFEPSVIIQTKPMSFFGCYIEARNQGQKPAPPSEFASLQGSYDTISEVSGSMGCHLLVRERFQQELEKSKSKSEAPMRWEVSLLEPDLVHIKEVLKNKKTNIFTCRVSQQDGVADVTHKCKVESGNQQILFYFNKAKDSVLVAGIDHAECRAYHTRAKTYKSVSDLSGTYSVKGVAGCQNKGVQFSKDFVKKVYLPMESSMSEKVKVSVGPDMMLTSSTTTMGDTECDSTMNPNVCSSNGKTRFHFVDSNTIHQPMVIGYETTDDYNFDTEYNGCMLEYKKGGGNSFKWGPWVIALAIFGAVALCLCGGFLLCGFGMLLRKRILDDGYNQILSGNV